MSSILPSALAALLLCGILAVSIYEIVTATRFSLPNTPLNIATLILTLFAAINTLYAQWAVNIQQRQQRRRLTYHQHQPDLNGNGDSSSYSPPSSSPAPAAPRIPLTVPLLQLLQFALSLILATLLGRDAFEAGGCDLETAWKRMYSAHDADAIRRIQDGLGCCGFNSVKDRAWPFPSGPPPEGGAPPSGRCDVLWGRTTACRGPWAGVMRGSAAVEVGVLVVVGVFQLVNYLAMNRTQTPSSRRGDGGGQNGAIRGVGGWVSSLFGEGGRRRALLHQPTARRALLVGRDAYTDDDDEVEVGVDNGARGDGGRDAALEEEEEGRETAGQDRGGHHHIPVPQHGQNPNRQLQQSRQQQSTGPRLEPSLLGEARNEWEGE